MPNILLLKGCAMKKKCHQHNFKVESKYSLEKLRGNAKRITQQRKDIVREILRFNTPFSADELHLALKKKDIDLTTIYRSLATFCEIGILTTIDFSDGPLRYEYIPKNDHHHHHHHVVCSKCKTVEQVTFCDVHEQEKRIAQMGYSQVYHKLEFFGLCRSCTG